MIALGLLAFSAVVTLRVEASSGVAPDVATAMTEALGHAIEARTGDKTKIELEQKYVDGECVLVSFFGGLTKIRMVAERISPLWGQSSRIEIELMRDPKEARVRAMDEAARRLFSETPRATSKIEVALTVEKKNKVTPWIAGGAGLAALGGGIAFSAIALNAKHRLSTEQLDSPEATTLDHRMRIDGIIGGTLLVAALGALTAAVLLLVNDER